MYSSNRNTFHSQTHRVPFSEIDLLRLRNLVKAFCCLQSSSDERTYAYTVASNRVIHIRNELTKMNCSDGKYFRVIFFSLFKKTANFHRVKKDFQNHVLHCT